MIKDYRKAARRLKALGISIVPLRTDGSKLPKMKWGHLQDEYISDKELEYQFKECGGIAAITGEISRLYVLDFDLKYQFETQDFWKDFMAGVPKELKKKFLINTTKNAGMHVWVRTDFEDKSRHYTRRPSTIPELLGKYEALQKKNDDPIGNSRQILKNPYEVVIESRSRGSYAVIVHPEYNRLYGEELQEVTVEEVEFLNTLAYSLDYCFIPKSTHVATKDDYKTAREYNDDATPELVSSLLSATGMYTEVGKERNGTLLMLRTGSKSKYSGKIFGDNAVFYLHSSNAPLFDVSHGNAISPFDVYRVCKNLTYEQAVNELNKK